MHFMAGVDVPRPGILLGFDGVPQEACASFRVMVGFVVVVIIWRPLLRVAVPISSRVR